MKLKTFSPSYSKIVFNEPFLNVGGVTDNGGVIGGSAVTIGKYTGDGTTAKYIRYPSVEQIYGTVWSIRVKFLTNADTNNNFLIAKDKAGRRSFSMGLGASNVPYLELYPGGGGIITDRTAISKGVVHDIIYTSDGTNLRCYIDGVQNGKTGVSVDVERVLGNLTIGRRDYSGAEGSFNGEIYDVQLFQGVALTALEAKDLYDQDTYAEIERPIIDLPLRSSYYKENGVEILTNGDFSNGTTGWIALRSTLSVVVDGTYGNSLLITNNGSGQAYAYETKLTVGKRYKATGRGKAVATGNPRIVFTTTHWQGETNTDWQDFDFEFVADVTGFGLTNSSANADTMWNDLSVELMENQTENKGSLGGTALVGDGSTTTTMPTLLSPHGMSFDGGDWMNLGTVLNNYFLHTKPFSVTILIDKIKDISGAILDSRGADGIGIEVGFNGTQGFRLFFWEGGSIYSGQFHSATAKAGRSVLTITYNGGLGTGIKGYMDGVVVSANTQSSGTVASTTPVGDTNIGRRPSGSSYLPDTTKLFDFHFTAKELTASQVSKLHFSLIQNLNI